MIRILHVVSVMDVGGMESYIMNMYRRIDRTQVQFDFLVHHMRRGAFEDEIEALGGHVYHLSVIDDLNLLKYKRDLRALFSAHPEYRIVHGHLGSTAYWYLGEAKRQGVPWRILHSHCPGRINTLKGYVKHMLFYLSPVHANIHLACSDNAGRYQFRKGAFEVVPNGIDVPRFRFSAQSRQEVRSRLGIDDRFVVGHVGRFYYEKNHAYMLDILRALKEKAPDAMLMLLGEGKLMEDIRRRAQEMSLEDSVLFMGLQKDCAPYYQAMDAFIMPSIYEGLPLAGIESQCASLPCLYSDTVSAEAKISPLTQYLPIGEENVGRWAEELLRIRACGPDRAGFQCDCGAFDTAVSARKMVRRYQTLWESKP